MDDHLSLARSVTRTSRARRAEAHDQVMGQLGGTD
jgi:hypothetical protein